MATPSRIPQFGLAIDWETSGYSLPNYADCHQGISFGAIIFDVKTLDVVEELYREIKFDPKYEWSAKAESIHGLSRSYLAEHGSSQEEAAVDLANLVVKYIGTDDVLLLGHRVLFDRAFTQQLTKSIGVDFSYNPTVFDSCALGTLLLEATYSDEIFKIVGLPVRGKHNALEDIQYTLESIKHLKNLFALGVASTF